MKTHLRELEETEKAQKHTCLGRRGPSAANSAHLPKKRGVRPLLESIRDFVALWEHYNNSIADEDEVEFALRTAARDALRVVEDHANWLEAESDA